MPDRAYCLAHRPDILTIAGFSVASASVADRLSSQDFAVSGAHPHRDFAFPLHSWLLTVWRRFLPRVSRRLVLAHDSLLSSLFLQGELLLVIIIPGRNLRLLRNFSCLFPSHFPVHPSARCAAFSLIFLAVSYGAMRHSARARIDTRGAPSKGSIS